jgi:hypothetical protein
MKGVRISGREDDSTEQILSQLHRLVSARPPGPDNKPGQVCAEILASIREAQGARAPEVKLSRAQRRELQALSALYAAARGRAAETRKLDLRLMSALPGSTRIVEDLKERGATAKLDAADIVKDQQIWARLGSNEKGELNRLAEALGVGIPDFLEALASSSLAAAAEFGPSPLRRHAMDAVILGVMLAVLLMLAGVLRRGIRFSQPDPVVAVRDIAPFAPIGPGDVTPQKTDEFIGRYSAVRIARGAVVTSRNLSAGKLSGTLANRSVLRIQAKLGKAALPWRLPATVTLLAAPRHSGTEPLVLNGVYLLAIQDNGDTSALWVAVDSSRLLDLTARLGDAELLLAQP